MDVTVVTPTYQRAKRLHRLLEALAAQDHPTNRFEVIVVDDGSTDETASVLDAAMQRGSVNLRVIRQSRNGGPAPARNAGARSARAPIVAFIDDDCIPEPGWVAAMARAFVGNDHLGVVQGRTVAPDGERGPWTIAREISGETPWFEGCNIAYRRDALLASGGFDEVIGWYGEDTAAGWRVVEAGWLRGFVGGAVVTHDLEERGIRWRIRHAWLETNLVGLAAHHPGLRRSAFARRWAFRRESITLPLAAIGLAGAPRRPPLIVLVVPYLLGRRSLLRHPADLGAFVVVDAAAIAGHLAASMRHRTFVL